MTPDANPMGCLPPGRERDVLPLVSRPRIDGTDRMAAPDRMADLARDAKPELSEPVAMDPVAMDPVAMDPVAMDPVAMGPVVIDCDRCSMRGIGCGDCMVTVLLGGPPYGVALDDEERRAIEVLAEAGLIPPLRMVSPVDSVHIVD